MFYESRYPKKELKRISVELKEFSSRFLSFGNWNYKLEKNCFTGFYFIRKLIESQTKVTTNLKNKKIKIKSYNFIGRKNLFRPVGAPDEYNFNNPIIEEISIYELSHQFIHSVIFFGNKIGKGLNSVFVSSDQQIYNKIYEIDLISIINIFEIFSENDVIKVSFSFNNKTGKTDYLCE